MSLTNEQVFEFFEKLTLLDAKAFIKQFEDTLYSDACACHRRLSKMNFGVNYYSLNHLALSFLYIFILLFILFIFLI